MDVDFWSSKVHSSKHQTVIRAARPNSDECSERNPKVEELRKKLLKLQIRIKLEKERALSSSNLSGVSQQNDQQEGKKSFDVPYEDEQDYEDVAEEDDYEFDTDEADVFVEGDEDTRACFPCPFCFVEIEIHALCSHLQEEHCFDLKNAVCPLCAATLGKDATGHFLVQHASLLKRRRKSQKSGSWPVVGSISSVPRELKSFIGHSTVGRGTAHESSADSLLSPFLSNTSISDSKNMHHDQCLDDDTSIGSNLKRGEGPFSDKDEQDPEERRQRAAFVQQLVMSTTFEDLHQLL